MKRSKVKTNCTSKACGTGDRPPRDTGVPIGKASLVAVLSEIAKIGPLAILECAMTAQTMKDIVESETVPRFVKSAVYVPYGRPRVGRRGPNGRIGTGTGNELENESEIVDRRVVVRSNVRGFATIAILLTGMVISVSGGAAFFVFNLSTFKSNYT